jgi:hypothetical protein
VLGARKDVTAVVATRHRWHRRLLTAAAGVVALSQARVGVAGHDSFEGVDQHACCGSDPAAVFWVL